MHLSAQVEVNETLEPTGTSRRPVPQRERLVQGLTGALRRYANHVEILLISFLVSARRRLSHLPEW
jgi:hypothetical protein